MSWLSGLDDSIINFLYKLKKENSKFDYSPVIFSDNTIDENINLGFSCYALKILKLTDEIKKFSENDLNEWSRYLKSYQNRDLKYPINSFIDKSYINSFKSSNYFSGMAYPLKYLFNTFQNKDYKSNKQKIENYIRAETKQTISTLYEINKKNENKYKDFPINENEVKNYLNSLNWSYPWSSGGQFSAMCVFSKTQTNNEEYKNSSKSILEFADSIVNQASGLYYKGNPPKNYELINGAMKVLTGLDWLEAKIHYPEKIIDFCLSSDISSKGCDMVDVVYVLYRCSKETNYKKKEVIDYLDNILKMIKVHYNPNDGGFSYFQKYNQTHYYDLKIADTQLRSDIHGTLLCVWAIVMIMDLSEKKFFNFNVLKP
ncbi:MAG: hypothetical protein CMA12_08350 [Euryarchaeota archaeon]|nr:hypothetical protein [Euryarchaeota archaeon]